VWRVVKGPGPGTYKEISTRADGIYPVSTFERTKSPEWRPKLNPNATKYERVPYTGKLPGPGFYDLSSLLMSQILKSRGPKNMAQAKNNFGTQQRKVFVPASCKFFDSLKDVSYSGSRSVCSADCILAISARDSY
jgi:hypothetical protein